MEDRPKPRSRSPKGYAEMRERILKHATSPEMRAALEKSMNGYRLASQQAAQFRNGIAPQKVDMSRYEATWTSIVDTPKGRMLAKGTASFMRHPDGAKKYPANALVHRSMAHATGSDASHMVARNEGGRSVPENLSVMGKRFNRGANVKNDTSDDKVVAEGNLVHRIKASFSRIRPNGVVEPKAKGERAILNIQDRSGKITTRERLTGNFPDKHSRPFSKVSRVADYRDKVQTPQTETAGTGALKASKATVSAANARLVSRANKSASSAPSEAKSALVKAASARLSGNAPNPLSATSSSKASSPIKPASSSSKSSSSSSKPSSSSSSNWTPPSLPNSGGPPVSRK